ncbi:thermonuclease family protein [uncultured Metabacillus sp.]|uniref:thermonuclease family protein n=1 Tax=uncultured Metabacillus sp. TaxID=2860135 RepID=UPI00263680B2|nr:thermonuclease family protein [uncultured Metabacillus sp.]
MRIWMIAVITLFLTTACVLKENGSDRISAHITRVVDGDTVHVTVNGKEETVRLLLVDTPETVHPTKQVQPFGPEASSFVKKLLHDADVELELDIGERDKYGRLLAYLYVNDEMVNQLLLEKGLARVAYVFEPNTKYVDKFYKIQKHAMAKGIGIWSIENYATDQGFNEDPSAVHAENKTDECTIKGNINSKGEKIFHTENSPSYKVTKPEKMFCTEAEAIAEGYRAVNR